LNFFKSVGQSGFGAAGWTYFSGEWGVSRSSCRCWAPAPTDEEIKEVTETTAFRVLGLLERRGVIGEDDVMDPLGDEFPILAGMTGASVQGFVATGERAGMRVGRVLSDPAEGIRTLC
ncbi:MAG: hypothetical protein GY847_29060, partial [Proteobacteria bacterium]|nr:hypothetical protein [Pseudomonadota bacterium]